LKGEGEKGKEERKRGEGKRKQEKQEKGEETYTWDFGGSRDGRRNGSGFTGRRGKVKNLVNERSKLINIKRMRERKGSKFRRRGNDGGVERGVNIQCKFSVGF